MALTEKQKRALAGLATPGEDNQKFHAGVMPLAGDEGPSPPNITTTAAINSAEDQLSVVTMAATGDEPITWSLVGGADIAKFSIVAATGVVTWNTLPDYEDPQDVGADNIYNVTVRATNVIGTDDLALIITVTDETEVIPPASDARCTRTAISLAIGIGM
jgi:hypothetical protein